MKKKTKGYVYIILMALIVIVSVSSLVLQFKMWAGGYGSVENIFNVIRYFKDISQGVV